MDFPRKVLNTELRPLKAPDIWVELHKTTIQRRNTPKTNNVDFDQTPHLAKA